jgi:hypothetical protein
MAESPSVSALLAAWGQGDPLAVEQLTPKVYGELHKIAHAYLRGRVSGKSLQPTALINALQKVTNTVVEAARESLVIGQA